MPLHPDLESILNWLELPNELADRIGNTLHKQSVHQLTQADEVPENCTLWCSEHNEAISSPLLSDKQEATVNMLLLSEVEQQLKWRSHHDLQELLKSKRFPHAIALVEGLAARLPGDPDVRGWQAISYQRWGRQLLKSGQVDKARIYLKKALKADPHNQSLWTEVEKDFHSLSEIF